MKRVEPVQAARIKDFNMDTHDIYAKLRERGKHARSAFCLARIPLGACVEIELTFEVASGHDLA
ncbi:hypothetical protein [Cupriavidus yeoncheonensis]|nr:hypothetical protein [Cupriavidus yeoncheonensis]